MAGEKKLAETVQHDGTTLYAPVVACRPIRPQNYPPSYLRVWKEMTAGIGRDPQVYTDSTPDKCESCHIAVWVGPRQLVSMEVAHELGLATHVTCLVCASLLTAEVDESAIVHLGNPEPVILTPNCPLCSQPPAMVLDDGHQNFCGNDDCPAVVWDSHKDLDTLLTSFSSIDLSGLEPPDVH
jgi:hypothetical protein